MLLKKDTYVKTSAELVSVDNFKHNLMVANIGVSILILLIAITFYFGIRLTSQPIGEGADDLTLFF
jgi:hypothetical protein